MADIEARLELSDSSKRTRASLFRDRQGGLRTSAIVLTYRLLLLVFTTGLCVSVGPTANATSPATLSRVTLHYEAPDSCPTQSEFIQAVARRGSTFDTPSTKRAARAMNVTIHGDTHGFAGLLEVRENDVISEPRQVHAEDCAEVTDGLAVVTAIALRGDPEPKETQPHQGPPPDPSDEQGLRKVADVFTYKFPVSAGTLAFKSVLPVTVSFGAAVGVIPSLVLQRIDLNLFRANFVTTPAGETYLVGPILRARVSVLGEQTLTTVGYSTKASGFSFGMSGCRAAVYDTRGLMIMGCLEYAGGVMLLETRDANGTTTQSKSVGLGTIGAGGQAQYNFGRYFHIDLNLGGDLSVSKLTAERLDGTEIFHSRPFSAYATAGVGIQF